MMPPSVESTPSSGDRGEFLTRTYDGRSYRLYVPSGYEDDEPAALVVMLHGCRQTPEGFAAETEMNAVAEDETFLVAYPRQVRRANIGRCWNWFDDAETTRGRGEVARIAGTVGDVASEYAVDDERIYVAGLSAGGAMAAHAIVAYPDLFAAAGVHAGLGYDAADGVLSALYRMKRAGPDPVERAEAAYAAMGERARPIPTIVFHGTDDDVVAVENGEQVADLALRASRLATGDGSRTENDSGAAVDGGSGRDAVAIDGAGTVEPDATEVREVGPYTCRRSEFHDGAGRVLVERWIVEGMNHAWAGGSPGGRYSAPTGPDASRETWRFFAAHELSDREGRPSTALEAADDTHPWDATEDGRLSEAWHSIRERVESKFG